MPTSEDPSASRSEPSPPIAREPDARLPWPAIGMSAVFILVVLGLFILTSKRPKPHTIEPPVYAPQLSISGPQISRAQNFVGATVTYLEGTLNNKGDKTLIGGTVQAVFKNSLGEIVQKEEQPIKALSRSGPYPDAIDLRFAPLKPKQSCEFRLTFEHISADWNQQIPDLEVIELKTQ